MDAANYSLQTGSGPVSASKIIALLDPANPLHAAHIGEVWTLCKAGMRYSGHDYDVLSAALAASRCTGRVAADHERNWVARWSNCPAHIADARRWAIGLEG